MTNEKKEEINNEQMIAVVRQNPKYKIKSMLTFILLILIIIGIIIFMGTIIPEFFVFIIFLIVFSLPVIILLRKRIYDIVPSFIKNSLLEIDQRDEENVTQNFSISKKYKQILVLVFCSILFIGSLNYLKKFNKQIAERKSITKFLGSFVCIIIAGISMLEIENI